MEVGGRRSGGRRGEEKGDHIKKNCSLGSRKARLKAGGVMGESDDWAPPRETEKETQRGRGKACSKPA